MDNLHNENDDPGWLKPWFNDYVLPNILFSLPKMPVLHEVGIDDSSCSIELGRDKVFKVVAQVARDSNNRTELVIHNGGHEVDGEYAIKHFIQY